MSVNYETGPNGSGGHRSVFTASEPEHLIEVLALEQPGEPNRVHVDIDVRHYTGIPWSVRVNSFDGDGVVIKLDERLTIDLPMAAARTLSEALAKALEAVGSKAVAS